MVIDNSIIKKGKQLSYNGELPEWLKERFAKPWLRKRPVGSNPALSVLYP